MISNLDGASQLFLADLGRLQERLADANREVTSGKKISQPSDAPDQIDSLLQLRANQQHNQQVQSNLALAKTSAQTADDTLSSAIQLMDRALVLAAQGANSTTDTAGRQSLAQEVQSLLQEMVAFSQSTVQGQYIFSGDHADGPAYTADPTSPTGVAQLSDSAATRTVADASGGTFVAAKNAEEIFDQRNPDGTAAAGNVFSALSGMAAALLSGDPQNVTQAIAGIKSASDHLNSMEAFYGTVEDRIDSAQSFASKYDTQLQTQLSQTEDADVTGNVLELVQIQTQLQAAFQMQAATPRKSLFEYLG